MKWSNGLLDNIVKADDLYISPFRDDGKTYGTPTWVWCVSVDGELYVRAYFGLGSSWYQAAVKQMAGQIITTGIATEVIFEPVKGAINKRIDDAYREKYRGSPYVARMIEEPARSSTVKIIPKGMEV